MHTCISFKGGIIASVLGPLFLHQAFNFKNSSTFQEDGLPLPIYWGIINWVSKEKEVIKRICVNKNSFNLLGIKPLLIIPCLNKYR